jgi:hypothetical protein
MGNTDTLWYPMWNKPYIRGAGEAIPQAIMLKRRQISIDFGSDLKQLSTSQRMRSPSRMSRASRRGFQSSRGASLSPSRTGGFGLDGMEPEPGTINKYAYDEDEFDDAAAGKEDADAKDRNTDYKDSSCDYETK